MTLVAHVLIGLGVALLVTLSAVYAAVRWRDR